MKFPGFVVRKTSVYLGLLVAAREKNSGFEVLYTAGFGYQNIGDEAQLSTNLQIWDKISDKVSVTLLSTDPAYTRKEHGSYDVLFASRNILWGYKNLEYSGIGETKFFQLFFRLKFTSVMLTAFFVKYFNIGLFASPELAYFLKRLKNADLLHIGGGGYLTGKTPSRLFDYMGLIRLSNFLNTDIILSGHNIGIWQNKYQRRMGKHIKKAKFIGLRDDDKSIESLKQISVYDEKKVIPLFDDALFCENANPEIFNKYLKLNSLEKDTKYILINAYYFKSTEKQVKETLLKLNNIIEQNLNNRKIKIVLLAMHYSDLPALKFIKKNLKVESEIFRHDDNFRIVISLIRNAYAVISTRHHPLIFAMSGAVPILSIVFDAYFKHKNIGAMKLFGQEKYVLDNSEIDSGEINIKLKYILENKNSISKSISNKLDNFKGKKGYIIKEYLEKYTNIKKNQ